MHVFPLLGFIEIKTALLVFHLVGLALGAGVAFFSAILFMKVMHDGYVTKKEMQILSITSTTVAIGLSLLALSGLGLFLLNQTAYLADRKSVV